MNSAALEAEIKEVLEKLCVDRIEFAYLLGSAGTPRFRPESDIDLAVYWKGSIELSEQCKIANELNLHFNREIDLVNLNIADLIFSRQVLETGRLLMCRSAGSHLAWKADQLSRYPDFKQSREVIEKNILNRKKYV
jgi:predicted nucleotidyltransferase